MAKFLKKQTKQRHPTLNFQNLEIANQFHTGTFNSLELTPQNKSSDSVTNLLKWSPCRSLTSHLCIFLCLTSEQRLPVCLTLHTLGGQLFSHNSSLRLTSSPEYPILRNVWLLPLTWAFSHPRFKLSSTLLPSPHPTPSPVHMPGLLRVAYRRVDPLYSRGQREYSSA